MNKPRVARAFALHILAGAFLASTFPSLAQNASHTSALAAQLHEAIEAAKQGDGTRALTLTHALLVEHPDYEPALKFQGVLLEQSVDAQGATASYQRALKLAPNDSELMLKVGIFDLIGGDRDQAISLLTHRLKVTPRDGDALYYLAQAYHLKGDSDLALKTIRACVKADPQNASVWQKYGELLCSSGDNLTALKWLAKAQQADPTLDRIDFDLGVASFNNQDLDNAQHYAANAVAQSPNDFKALALLASVDVKLAKWQEAKTLFQQILSVRPDDTAALLGLGHCDLELKNYHVAADTLERVLQLDPTQALAHFYLSRSYAALGRRADAQHEAELHTQMLEQAASMASSSDNELQKATVASARQLLAENREADALQLLREQSNGIYATAGSPYMLTGAIYLYMSRYDDAARCLNRALAIEPSVRGAHTYLGVLAMQEGNLDKAESEFKAELAGNPDYQMATAELGEVRYRQGRWTEAAAQLAKSRTALPYLLYMLSDAYFHLGKTKEADLTAELVVDYAKGDRDVVKSVIDLLNRNQQTDLAQRLASKTNS